MSDPSRKRSRFDQTDAEADLRRSRFDRRSRSPADRRSRSPAPADSSSKAPAVVVPSAAAAAAAAAAAKINAQLQAKLAAGKLSPASNRPVVKTAASGLSDSNASGDGTHSLKEGIYEQDGDFIKDVEVNDLRNRYTLTKGATQKMIKEKTGADVTTRGAYYPDKSMATAVNPPLYLHITSRTKEGLEAAIAEIEEMMKQALPNLIDERRMPRNRREETFERDERGRRKWPDEKIPIPLEPINGFNLRAQVVGQQGMYVKHIQSESGARVQIKGRGSGFLEHDSGVEADEPMFLHVTAPEQSMVDRGKELCLDLLENVKTQYEEFKERDRNRGYGDRRGGGYGHRDGGGYGGRGGDRSDSYGGYGGQSSYGGNSQYGGTSQYGGAQSPTAGAAQNTAGMTAEQQQWMAWAAANPEQAQQYYAAYYAQQAGGTPAAGGQAAGSADPYAAYGGYDAYVRMYSGQGAQQGYAQAAEAPPPPPSSAAAPPPPPSGNEAAPPPPPGTGAGYNSVPPPPGL